MQRYFTFGHDLKVVMRRLLNVQNEMNATEQDIVFNIAARATRRGNISYRELQVLGRIYKRYLQDDEFVHHNWPIWK